MRCATLRDTVLCSAVLKVYLLSRFSRSLDGDVMASQTSLSTVPVGRGGLFSGLERSRLLSPLSASPSIHDRLQS
jgi:hypothetical protein